MDNIDLNDDAEMFDLAPVSLWLEDYSALKALFDGWRADGVTDLRAHFARRSRARAGNAPACIRLIKVNRKTLALFEADDAAHLVANLGRVFRDDMLTTPCRGTGAALGGQAVASPATPSITRCRAAGSTSSCKGASCRATRKAGSACWSRSRT